jgi:hypothetical protein
LTEKTDSKKKKEEPKPQPGEDFLKQIQVNVRAMNANLGTFNEKEKEKMATRDLIVQTIKMQLGGLSNSLAEIKDLSAE